MDTKVTLSFNKDIIEAAKSFASDHNISLSRLTEYLYAQIINGNFEKLEDFPISDWIHQVAEERAEYKISPIDRKKMKDEYFGSKK